MNAEELVKIVGPLLGLLILGIMVWKMFQTEDAGKKITSMIQSRKLIIADLFLVGLAFLEGLVAANMGDDALGDSYTTRFTSHFVLSMVGAYAGFICIKEVIDFVSKFYDGKHSIIYMFFQALQPLIYFVIAGVMPVFNLIIISKGAGSYEILSYLWSSDYSFTEVYGALDDVSARSLLMVAVHILLTTAVALGSIDDVEKPKEEKNKKDKKHKDKSDKGDASDDEDSEDKPSKEKGKKKVPYQPDALDLFAKAIRNEESALELMQMVHNFSGTKDNMRNQIVNRATEYKEALDLVAQDNSATKQKGIDECLKLENKFRTILTELRNNNKK